MLGVILALLASPPILPQASNTGPDGKTLTVSQHKKLDRGRVISKLRLEEGNPVKNGLGLIVIDAPPSEVYAVITDYDRRGEYMSYVKNSTMTKREGQRVWVSTYLDFPWPIQDRHFDLEFVESTETREGVEILSSSWKYVEDSGNVNDTWGTWEMCSYGENRTLLRFNAFTDPGGKIPVWVRNQIASVAVPNVLKSVRKRVYALRKKPKKKT